MAEECQCIVNIKLDTAKIKERDISHEHNVLPFKKKEYRHFSTPNKTIKKGYRSFSTNKTFKKRQ